MFRIYICLLIGFFLVYVDVTYVQYMGLGVLLAGAYLWLMSWLIQNRWFGVRDETE